MNQIHRWQGASGAWHAHTVFGFVKPSWATSVAANYVFVCRLADGTCRPLYFGETDDLCHRWGDHVGSGLIREAYGLGASELHLFLQTRSRQQRLDVETDLRNGHATPLNRQPMRVRTPNPAAPISALRGVAEPSLAAMTTGPARNAFGGLAEADRGLLPNALGLLSPFHALQRYNPLRGLS